MNPTINWLQGRTVNKEWPWIFLSRRAQYNHTQRRGWCTIKVDQQHTSRSYFCIAGCLSSPQRGPLGFLGFSSAIQLWLIFILNTFSATLILLQLFIGWVQWETTTEGETPVTVSDSSVLEVNLRSNGVLSSGERHALRGEIIQVKQNHFLTSFYEVFKTASRPLPNHAMELVFAKPSSFLIWIPWQW